MEWSIKIIIKSALNCGTGILPVVLMFFGFTSGQKSRARYPCHRAGFTLIELLVGMTIATMILGASAGVFVTTLNSWDKGSRQARLIQAAQATGDLIERRLRSTVPPFGNDPFVFEGEDLSDGETDGHCLTFLASSDGRIPRSEAPTDLSEVTFSFDPAEDEALSMRLDSSPDDLLDEGGYRLTLSPLVTAFKVLYFDGTDWVDDWSEQRLPRAVEFHLTFEEDEKSLSQGKKPYVYQISRLVTLPMATGEKETLIP